MTAPHRPRIGVSWVSAEEAAAHACVRAVRDAGGEPVPLLIEDESWMALLPGLDGLVLTGGNAVDPRRYGEENEGLCRVVIPRRDDLEQDTVDVVAGTRLAAVTRADGALRVNSRHHQGLRATQLAPGLRVTAVAADGVVEGLEAADGRFVVGVQFHPEIAGEVPEAAPIFDVLVSRAHDR